MTRNLDVVERFMARIWAEGHEKYIGDLVHDDATVFGLEEQPLHGTDDILRFRRMAHAQFSDFSFQTINAVESGDSIAVAGIVRASDLQTGHRGGARLHMLMQLRDGRIGMANILIDYLGFFESMGRLPPRILDQCLLGHLAPGLSRERA